jgi:methylated-DNA-[protein]-cysteine S-methyltransferase
VNCVFRTFDSPVGQLKLVARGPSLVAVLWVPDRPGRVDPGPMDRDVEHPVLLETEHQLRQYFAGERRGFDLPLSFGGTAFQRQVWQALLTIPFGQTRSYRALARSIGHEDAVRAVGAANGRNPISIVAPCHRVVGSAGQLTGFAGGIAAKRWLLRLEGAPECVASPAQASTPRNPPLWCAHSRA